MSGTSDISTTAQTANVAEKKIPHRIFIITIKINIFVIFAASLFFRLIHLENIPGINGDEAFYGVVTHNALYGDELFWKTASNNLLNPFYSGIIFLIHFFIKPSFLILRIPAVISGVLAIVVIYFLLSIAINKKTALIASILTATFPINIAYSRFGWDQSQACLISLIAIYFALKRHLRGVLISILIAVIIHPVNIFLLPFLAALFSDHWLSKLPNIFKNHMHNRNRFWTIFLGASSLFLITSSLIIFDADLTYLKKAVAFILNFGKFIVYYVQLLSGTTIYRYISGESSCLFNDIFISVICIIVSYFGIKTLKKSNMNQLIFFAYSLPPALFIFYCFGGIKAISPHYERYAMFLIAPSTILLAILINNTFIRSYLKGLSLTVIIAWLFLFSFQTHYFKSIKRTSGLSHRTFRTAEIEPKKQAFASIIKDAKGEKNIVIIVEDWWLYWPITYLAKNHHNVSVYGYWGKPFPYLYSQITRVAKYNDKKMQFFLDKGYYIVGFTGGFLEKKLKKFDNLNKLHKWYIQDYSKRKLLFVCRKKTKNFSKAASPTLPENRPPS